jgi:dTDP-4-dehydrorhamnose reductase
MRVLVTGASGQLGRDTTLAFESEGRHDVVAADRSMLDVGDRDQVLQAVTGLRPELIVHCGAFTAVDRCETEIERSFRDNAYAVRHMGEAARRTGAHLVYVSTDYVFDGTKIEPYHEWDTPNPQSVYGASKLAGERECGPETTIVRTSWVCGEHGPNMVKTVLRVAAQQDTLSFVDDQRGHPTFTADLALMLRRLAIERRPGVFHVTNQGSVSWYQFVREILIAAGLDPERVRPISTVDLDPPRPAPRPANSVLDNAALRMAGVPLLRDFREPLAELVRALRP